MAFVQQDVLRLDVAVHYALTMSVVERIRHFDGQLEHCVDGKLAVGVEPVA